MSPRNATVAAPSWAQMFRGPTWRGRDVRVTSLVAYTQGGRVVQQAPEDGVPYSGVGRRPGHAGTKHRTRRCSRFHCDRCGANGDRDYMAALNIGAEYPAEQAARRQAEHAGKRGRKLAKAAKTHLQGVSYTGASVARPFTSRNTWFPILSGRHGQRRERQGYRQWMRPGGGAVRLARQVRPRLADRLPRAAPCGCLSATILTYAHVPRNGSAGRWRSAPVGRSPLPARPGRPRRAPEPRKVDGCPGRPPTILRSRWWSTLSTAGRASWAGRRWRGRSMTTISGSTRRCGRPVRRLRSSHR